MVDTYISELVALGPKTLSKTNFASRLGFFEAFTPVSNKHKFEDHIIMKVIKSQSLKFLYPVK